MLYEVITPFFGAALLIMAFAIAFALISGELSGSFTIREIGFADLRNMHFDTHQNILFPMLFIVIRITSYNVCYTKLLRHGSKSS